MENLASYQHDGRVGLLAGFARRMGDIKISRHPLRRDVMFILNRTEFDHYQDSASVEEARIYKQVIVRKNVDLMYIQESFGDDALVEDVDGKLPFVVCMTQTGLVRLPMVDDRFLIDGALYSIARVKPVNRDSQGIVECMVYPERSEVVDGLALYSVVFRVGLEVKFYKDVRGGAVIMDMIYGGNPLCYSFDKINWVEFAPCVRCVLPVTATTVWVRDDKGVVGGWNFVKQKAV